jgi:sphingomyelin phosphodiesterase
MESDHANQMKWLEETFKDAEEKNEKIVILGHIKPGAGSRWPEFKLVHYEKLMQKYHDRVIGQFYGHSHADDFAFMMSQDNKILHTMFVGGVVVPSPKNPTVRLYKYDADNFKLLDYEDFYIPLSEANRDGKIVWKSLYKFTEEYNVPDLSSESFTKVYQSFQNSDVDFKKYLYNFRSRVSEPQPCTGSCKKNKLCGMISPTAARLEECRK